MIPLVLLFNYILGVHLFLIVLYVRGQHWKKSYQEALMDSSSLERVRQFFKTIQPLLKLLYPLVDRLNKPVGHPSTDRRFQLRFLFWWKFFAPLPKSTAIKRFNTSPNLQTILEAPEKPYTRFALRRFLEAIGDGGFIQMGLLIIAMLVKKGVLDISKIILDSFPIYSFLNWAKCLRMPKFDKNFARQFFHLLSLEEITKLFPKQHWKAAPLADKLKVWIHHWLWDIPSVDMNHRVIFGEKNHQQVMVLEKGWKTAQTYRNFITFVKQLSNFATIEQAILTEARRVLGLLGSVRKGLPLRHIEDLCQVFHSPHRFKDPGITLNYCSSKNQTFMGRGGLIAAAASLELPLLLQTTTRYKQSEKQIVSFLTDLRDNLRLLLKDLEVYGDAEFGTQTIKQAIVDILQAIAHVDNYGNSSVKSTLTADQKRIRKTVERVIARLETNFQIEHPRFLGPKFVAIHTQLCYLCDLFLVSFNVFSDNQAHPHSLKRIRGY